MALIGDAEADRRFLRDVLDLSSVDAGGGWLIFALPPAEMAFHPGEPGDRPRFSLPSGLRVGLYQPYHPLAIQPR